MLVLANKCVVVTGASSDFGKSLCVRLAESGARIFGTARNASKVTAARDFVRERVPSAQIDVFPVDLRFPDQIAACALAVAQNVQRVDVLINNAALWLEGEMEAPSADAISETISSTFTGTTLIVKHFLPLLEAAGSADIVNISSESAAAKSFDRAHESYAAAKHAMDAVTRRVRQRMRCDLRVTTIYPPRFVNIAAAAAGGWQTEPATQPLLCMTSKEIWNAVSFALSQDRLCSIDHIYLSNNPRRP